MYRFNLSVKDVKPNMVSVSNVNVYFWSYLYWSHELEEAEERLKHAKDDEHIGFCRFCVVEAKKVLVELYEKMIQMPELSDGMISKPDWMDAFLNIT